MANELLPCPFCGGEGIIKRYGDHRVSTIYECGNCECRLETCEEFDHGAVWNRRHPAPAIPEGWQLVPKEPTEEMALAACNAVGKSTASYAYKAMLAAAPQPPVESDSTASCVSKVGKSDTQTSLSSIGDTQELRAAAQAVQCWIDGIAQSSHQLSMFSTD